MKCLTQKPNIEPDYFMNEGMLPPFFEAIHRDFRTNKFLRYLIDELLPIKEGEDMGLTLTELIRYAYKYPVLLFPIFDFQKMWRRKMFGEHFWSERIFEAHERPDEYEDARSKFGIEVRSCEDDDRRGAKRRVLINEHYKLTRRFAPRRARISTCLRGCRRQRARGRTLRGT